MKEICIKATLLSALLSFTCQAQNDNQPSQVITGNELTNISNEEGTAFYLKLGLGAVQFNDQSTKSSGLTGQRLDFKTGIGAYATAGLNIGEHAAIELELSRQLSNISSDDQGTNFNRAIGSYNSAMVNFIFKPNLKNVPDNFNPYAGVGIGITKATYTSPGSPLQTDSDTVDAKQYILGNRFDLRDNYFIDAEYRYFKADSAQLVSETGVPFEIDNSGSKSIVVSYGRNF
jgi:opacity protein-like surface antigen